MTGDGETGLAVRLGLTVSALCVFGMFLARMGTYYDSELWLLFAALGGVSGRRPVHGSLGCVGRH